MSLSNYTKFTAIAQLCNVGQELDAPLDNSVMDLIVKIATPLPVPPTFGDLNPPAKLVPTDRISPTLDELMLARTRKIPAIKAYRERTGRGLKDSKDAIETGLSYLGWDYDPDSYAARFLFENLCPNDPY